jgi:hypothetical protein
MSEVPIDIHTNSMQGGKDGVPMNQSGYTHIRVLEKGFKSEGILANYLEDKVIRHKGKDMCLELKSDCNLEPSELKLYMHVSSEILAERIEQATYLLWDP